MKGWTTARCGLYEAESATNTCVSYALLAVCTGAGGSSPPQEHNNDATPIMTMVHGLVFSGLPSDGARRTHQAPDTDMSRPVMVSPHLSLKDQINSHSVSFETPPDKTLERLTRAATHTAASALWRLRKEVKQARAAPGLHGAKIRQPSTAASSAVVGVASIPCGDAKERSRSRSKSRMDTKLSNQDHVSARSSSIQTNSIGARARAERSDANHRRNVHTVRRAKAQLIPKPSSQE